MQTPDSMPQRSEDTASTPTTDGASLQCLTFWLRQQIFAIDIRKVVEIIPYANMTRVPRMPTLVRGVINLRGSVVPVLDLHGRFGWGKSAVDKRTCIVIYQASGATGTTPLGLMVDAVSEVIGMDPAGIEPTPQFGGVLARDFVQGMCKIDGAFVVLLKPEYAFDMDILAELVSQSAIH